MAWGETASIFAVRDGADLPNTKLRVAYYDGWTDRISLISGALPVDSSDGNLQAAMLFDTATAPGLHVSV